MEVINKPSGGKRKSEKANAIEDEKVSLQPEIGEKKSGIHVGVGVGWGGGGVEVGGGGGGGGGWGINDTLSNESFRWRVQ